METKHKYVVGQKVLFNDQIHTVVEHLDSKVYRVKSGKDLSIIVATENTLMPLLKQSDGQVYGATKPKATRPRKKVFSTDKSGK
jgi:hypothetical protein